MAIRVATLYRYPVKGPSAEPLERVALTPGESLPQDRRFALAHAATRFDPERPEWLPKTSFLMLMRDEKLARLRTRFDESSGVLSIASDGRPLLASRLTDAAGRQAVGEFFGEFLGESVDGTARVVEAPGHTFADAKRKPTASTSKYVSLVNLASVRAVEQAATAPVDPLRFRANLYFDGAPAWAELSWVGAEIVAGSARLHVVSAITRCAATTVNPVTAERDLDVPVLLRQKFGHVHMGVYAEVIEGGEVGTGDTILPPQEASMVTQPYSINLDVRHGPLELIDIKALAAACQDRWFNQTLCRVNDCVVRLGVVHGEFHWHKHDREDEFFYVLEGRWVIDLEGRTVELRPGQGFTVPKGVMHRTRAPERTVILMIEGAGVVPTGD